MKKYLVILFALFLMVSGCKSTIFSEDDPKEQDPSDKWQEEKPLQSVSLITSYDEIYKSYKNEAIQIYDEVYDTKYSEQKILSFVGREIPSAVLFDLNGNKINTDDLRNKRVIYEFAASYCSHCQHVSGKVLETIIEENPDVMFIQIFINGNADSVAEFYEAINKEIPDGLHVVPRSNDVISLVEGLGLEYLPSLIFQDEFGKICWYHQGSTDIPEMRRAFDKAFGQTKIYDLLQDGKSSKEDFILTYQDVKAHLDEESVSAIKEVFHGDEIDFYGNLGNSFYMDPIKSLSNESIPTSHFLDKKTVYIITFADQENEMKTNDLEHYATLSETYTDTEFVFVFKKSSDTQNLVEYYDLVKDKIGIAYSKEDSVSLNDIYISSAPLYIFVDENNRICGSWLNQGSFDDFDQAYQLFYSDVPLYERIK